MNQEISVQNNKAPSVLEDMATRFGMDKRAFEATIRATVMPANTQASNEQLAAFLLVAKQYSLNPFTKEIYAFPGKGGGIQPIVSVDGWLKIINEHPQFDGMEFKDTVSESSSLISVTCKIFRKDRSHPVEVTEYMGECRRDTDTWKRWPARMLRHKAAIQAARYAFGFAGIMEPDEAERMQESNHFGNEHIPAATIVDTRLQRMNEALEQYQESVDLIKDSIEKDDLYTAAETWYSLPQAAQMDLWVAPSKGGVFTTKEREIIKSSEFTKYKSVEEAA